MVISRHIGPDNKLTPEGAAARDARVAGKQAAQQNAGHGPAKNVNLNPPADKPVSGNPAAPEAGGQPTPTMAVKGAPDGSDWGSDPKEFANKYAATFPEEWAELNKNSKGVVVNDGIDKITRVINNPEPHLFAAQRGNPVETLKVLKKMLADRRAKNPTAQPGSSGGAGANPPATEVKPPDPLPGSAAAADAAAGKTEPGAPLKPLPGSADAVAADQAVSAGKSGAGAAAGKTEPGAPLPGSAAAADEALKAQIAKDLADGGHGELAKDVEEMTADEMKAIVNGRNWNDEGEEQAAIFVDLEKAIENKLKGAAGKLGASDGAAAGDAANLKPNIAKIKALADAGKITGPLGDALKAGGVTLDQLANIIKGVKHKEMAGIPKEAPTEKDGKVSWNMGEELVDNLRKAGVNIDDLFDNPPATAPAANQTSTTVTGPTGDNNSVVPPKPALTPKDRGIGGPPKKVSGGRKTNAQKLAANNVVEPTTTVPPAADPNVAAIDPNTPLKATAPDGTPTGAPPAGVTPNAAQPEDIDDEDTDPVVKTMTVGNDFAQMTGKGAAEQLMMNKQWQDLKSELGLFYTETGRLLGKLNVRGASERAEKAVNSIIMKVENGSISVGDAITLMHAGLERANEEFQKAKANPVEKPNADDVNQVIFNKDDQRATPGGDELGTGPSKSDIIQKKLDSEDAEGTGVPDDVATNNPLAATGADQVLTKGGEAPDVLSHEEAAAKAEEERQVKAKFRELAKSLKKTDPQRAKELQAFAQTGGIDAMRAIIQQHEDDLADQQQGGFGDDDDHDRENDRRRSTQRRKARKNKRDRSDESADAFGNRLNEIMEGFFQKVAEKHIAKPKLDVSQKLLFA
jgi:hypothetical protein